MRLIVGRKAIHQHRSATSKGNLRAHNQELRHRRRAPPRLLGNDAIPPYVVDRILSHRGSGKKRQKFGEVERIFEVPEFIGTAGVFERIHY